ncbi:hypothetical protein FOZ62_030833, partial [Perkinsus olseni]
SKQSLGTTRRCWIKTRPTSRPSANCCSYCGRQGGWRIWARSTSRRPLIALPKGRPSWSSTPRGRTS